MWVKMVRAVPGAKSICTLSSSSVEEWTANNDLHDGSDVSHSTNLTECSDSVRPQAEAAATHPRT
jgi:hypothetical protein